LQSVASFPFDDVVFCQRNDSEAFLLCSSTGRTLDVQHGIQHIYPSPFEKAVIASARRLELHSPFASPKGELARTTFAELDCAFSPSEVTISESGGPVRCFDLETLKLLWTHCPGEGTHFLRLCFSKPFDCFVGIRYHYEDETDPLLRIVRFERWTGRVIGSVEMGEPGLQEFCLEGTAVLTSGSDLVCVDTGKIIHRFTQDPAKA